MYSFQTRGQVKGKIVDKRGRDLVITRTMQVSRQKNNSLKFQAVDNIISRFDDKGKVRKYLAWKW